MANDTYYGVLAFVYDELGDLIAESPVEMPSNSAAVTQARLLARAKAGVIAFSRTGDPTIGEFSDAVELFRSGDVPEDAGTQCTLCMDWVTSSRQQSGR